MKNLASTQPTQFNNVNEVRSFNKSIGHHWFDKSSMRFFNSHVNGADKLINGRFFISSEQFNSESPRLFTIRIARPNGEVDTYGEFQAYKTRKEAIKAAHTISI
jgi:hypothetical protein